LFNWTYFFTFIIGLCVLYWFVFFIAVWLKSYFNDLRLEHWFGKDLGPIGYGLGALTGAVTPFCSCTTVPIFSGMIDSNVRLGYAISFLIASPTLNPPALILFYALFGGQMTLVYAAVCLVIAIVGGIILDREQLRKYLIEIFLINEDESFNLQAVNQQYVVFLRSLAPVVVIAAALATWLQSWTPSESLLSVLNHYQNAAIPGAVGIGGAVYADIAMLIPIGQLFLDKGLDIGLVFAFMMAASGVGLPSVLLLTRVFKKELLGLYLLTIFMLFTGAGFFVSWILT
jgi:hypothetical protein|tara:strand:- start:1897 stop:2754 length:858 start_codon:yes stop_codon:yes gene_type:complete